MTTKKRPLRMTVTQAACHSALNAAHKRVLAAEANRERDSDPTLVAAVRERAACWEKLAAEYAPATYVHEHLRWALKFAAQRDTAIANALEADQ